MSEEFEKWWATNIEVLGYDDETKRCALWAWNDRTPDTSAKVDVRLLNDAITLITKSLAAMLTDTSFASPYVEDHRPRVPSWVMTHFRHDHDRRVEYVNDIKQRLDWIRNATEKVRNEALQAPRSDTSAALMEYEVIKKQREVLVMAREALIYVEANYDGMNKADVPMKAITAIDNVMKGE